MARGAERVLSRPSGLDRLPETHWKQLRRVCWPGRPGTLIDHVLVGPGGIHVIRYLPPDRSGPSVAGRHDHQRLQDVGTAACSEYADAIGRLLPSRYRDRLRPVLCLEDDEERAEEVRGVLVTSSSTFEHIVRSSPAVLSTSEIAQVHACLQARLEHAPVQPVSRASRWRGALRVAAASTVVAAATTGAFVLGPDATELLHIRG